MTLVGGVEQMIMGGGMPPHRQHLAYQLHDQAPSAAPSQTSWSVVAVDVVRWLQAHFTPDDYVALKLDIEGEEHALLNKLLEANATGLVDVLLWECHALEGAKCHVLRRRLNAAGLRNYHEPPWCARAQNSSWECHKLF